MKKNITKYHIKKVSSENKFCSYFHDDGHKKHYVALRWLSIS